MIEDKLLVLKCRNGSTDALRKIYQKYKHDLLVLAAAILNDTSAAEDVLHDVFAAFVRTIDDFRLTGSLKGYLATCVANRARNVNRISKTVSLDTQQDDALSDLDPPDETLICNEQAQLLNAAIAELPDEQKQIIMLHLRSRLKFREIAASLGISTNTAKSRYRYGIEKLRKTITERHKN
jgi:RNA polymerase sigma-70 factor (ECF subfamily)